MSEWDPIGRIDTGAYAVVEVPSKCERECGNLAARAFAIKGGPGNLPERPEEVDPDGGPYITAGPGGIAVYCQLHAEELHDSDVHVEIGEVQHL